MDMVESVIHAKISKNGILERPINGSSSLEHCSKYYSLVFFFFFFSLNLLNLIYCQDTRRLGKMLKNTLGGVPVVAQQLKKYP